MKPGSKNKIPCNPYLITGSDFVAVPASKLASTTNTNSALADKVKKVIIDLLHSSDERIKTNFSVFLSSKLHYDYTYLANVFSNEIGTSIQQFIICNRIEFVKDLMKENTLTLTEIASKLHYSSLAHLSNQFKKETGLTPSSFKQSQICKAAEAADV